MKVKSQRDKVKQRMKITGLTLCILLLAASMVVWLDKAATGLDTDAGEAKPVEMLFVEEWDVVPAGEVDVHKLTKAQLLAEVEKSIKTRQAFHSWEAKYRVTWRQAPRVLHHTLPPDPAQDMSVPEIVRTAEARIISSGTNWFYKSKEETENKTDNSKSGSSHCYASNGKVIGMLWPDRKEAMVQSKDQYKGGFGAATIADFLPHLSAESCLTKRADFPEVFEILGDPDTQLLPWYTRVGKQTCYVLERTTTLRHPVFRNGKELKRWKRENPEKAEAWSKAARYGHVFIIDPQGKPGSGDTRVTEMKFRLAIAPKLGFAIVCWAYGYGSRGGAYRGVIFPDREIKYGDFHKVSKDLFIPHQMVYTNYRVGRRGQRHVAEETRLTVEEFRVNKQYQPELFEFDFPKGYSVIDTERGIIYTVGDSKEKIDTLVAAAKARDAFYKKLSQTQAPSLEPSGWINSAPIVLAEQKGRPIALYFWSLGCAPNMYQLPRLQTQYGHSAESSSGPLFISIHPFVNGDDLKQLEVVIRKYGITFPVMVDSTDVEGRSWGKTFKRYRVFSVPAEVRIDENGHFAGIDEDLISAGSWWLKKSDLNNSITKEK